MAWIDEWRAAIKAALRSAAETKNAEDDLKVEYANAFCGIETGTVKDREERARASDSYGKMLAVVKELRLAEADAKAKADALEKEYELHRTRAATARVRMQLRGDE